MSTHFNEKGKFFTQIVAKDPVQATIQTLTHRIEGTVHIRRGSRLIDELHAAGQFLPVTSAVIYDASGASLYRSDFVAVNLDHIIWLLPQEETVPPGAEAGGDER